MKEDKKNYKNVMELLVDQEINLQKESRKVSKNLSPYINNLEVATYALNRLPPLYASSTEGIERQKRRGKEDFKKKIKQAVSLGFAAVENDPLRKTTPLEAEQNHDTIQEVREILPELSTVIPRQELSWIVHFMEHFLDKIKRKQIKEEEVIKLYYLLYYYWQENQ